jgi:hypothetical protein
VDIEIEKGLGKQRHCQFELNGTEKAGWIKERF